MKKYLLSLLVCVFGFIGFSYAYNYNTVLVNEYSIYKFTSENFTSWTCIYHQSNNENYNNIYDVDWNLILHFSDLPVRSITCFDFDWYFKNDWWSSYSSVYYFTWIDTYSCEICDECSSCPEIDTNYCVENDLCPIPENFSQVFINDLEFPSKPLINVSIPDYITWDYLWSEESLNIYVWSGYDVDYINSIIDINSYRPTSEDFTNVFVGGLTLVMPYIFIALLIVFIRKLIKRIFK